MGNANDADIGAIADDEGLTLPDTSDRSLWRAATIVVDDDEPIGTVSVRGPDVASIAGRYVVREVLGAGGMGEVRLCRDSAIGRDVALKTLLEARAASEVAKRRFMREVRVQGQLEHPAIVPLYDLGAAPEGGLFFTMRRVRGRTLAEILDALARGDAATAASFSTRKLLEAFVRICLAVDYAHARGVIHRDLKPGNIMLGEFGEVHLLDWGLSHLVAERATEPPVSVSASDLGVRVGTPGYMSPEQVLGLGHKQGPRSDVYALGVILFEILALRRRHDGASFEEIARSTLKPDPVRLLVDVAPELEAACARAASTDPAARYASAREVAEAIERYLDGDRDMERRRDLASDRTTSATEAFARAAGPDATLDGAAIARAEAVRSVTAALALDPNNAEARRLLMRLFVEVPIQMPREVETEIADTVQRNRRHVLRFGSYGIASWVLTIPFVIAMGVQSWAPILVCSGLCVAALGYSLWLRRQETLDNIRLFALLALVFATIASVACWMGPFVLVPQAACVTTLWVVLFMHTRTERWVAIGMGAVAATVPFVLELAGVFAPAYTFDDGNIILHARTVRFSPAASLPMLVWASATFVVLPALFLGGVRDALSAAERQLFLQAWHLRQLVKDEPSAR